MATAKIVVYYNTKYRLSRKDLSFQFHDTNFSQNYLQLSCEHDDEEKELFISFAQDFQTNLFLKCTVCWDWDIPGIIMSDSYFFLFFSLFFSRVYKSTSIIIFVNTFLKEIPPLLHHVVSYHPDRGQRTEDRGQRTEDRGQRAEGRGQRAEGRGQRAEDSAQILMFANNLEIASLYYR